MRIQHLTETDYKVGLWSGGSTTELFIWPQNANYATREFSFRVSSARVDLPESDFTPLVGVTRYITPLTGSFTLTHPDGSSITMAPMAAPYRFSGETPTHCVGCATDFNLMLKGVQGRMEQSKEIWQLQPGFNCLYATTPTQVTLAAGYSLQMGELLVVFAEEAMAVAISAEGLTCWAEI